jgi:hypothetical protein
MALVSSAGDGDVRNINPLLHPFSHLISVYINLPICLAALLILAVSLRNVPLGDASDVAWRSVVNRFDFGGLYIFFSAFGDFSCS